MYRNCIFCAGELGRNEVLETFPVGRQLAFDAWKGRLWVVCPRCARWNLSPIEERWESIEAAEKLFRDARMRVQSENVGLARLPDGTRLVRIGEALAGELAAWRYGRQLLRRRTRYLLGGVVGGIGSIALFGGAAAAGGGVVGFLFATRYLERRSAQKVVHRVSSREDPAGEGLVIRRWHVAGMSLHPAGGDRVLEVHIRDAHRAKPNLLNDSVDRTSQDIVALSGASARTLLSRAMVQVNRKGASAASLDEANYILTRAGSAERLLREAAEGGAALGRRAGIEPRTLQGAGALAFEMALNDEAERRAMEGELAALEAAWREAEEIAAIADALPGEAALNRLFDRLGR